MLGTIISVVAFAAAAVTVVATLAEYWQQIVSWLDQCIKTVKKIVEGVVYGFKVFVQKTGEAIKEISKHYSKDGDQWTLTTQTKLISQDEVPEEILAKAYYNRETDITDEVEEQLELA